MGRAAHLTRRFFGALSPRGPAAADEAWVADLLTPHVHTLWRRMSGPDRRHAVGVAHQVPREWAAAALMHDVGKIESGLGTIGRVPATLVSRTQAERWRVEARGVRRRIGIYRGHAEIGSSLLRDAGADALTVAWAAEHHLPPAMWTVPAATGVALKAADDD